MIIWITRCAIVVSLLAGTVSLAQKPAKPGTTWKKIVTREITIPDPHEEGKHHLQDAGYDTSFTEHLFYAVRHGKITAYSTFEHSFTEKKSPKAIENMVVSPPDTQVVIDPVTGAEKWIVIQHDMDYSTFKRYRILEEWTFDRSGGNTSIRILGIAPVRDVYGADGTLRGPQMAFWIKYSDVTALLDRYEQYHPGASLFTLVWNDYFYTDNKPKS